MSPQEDTSGAGWRETARSLAEQAMRAQSGGDSAEADWLFAAAERIDPEAVAAMLQHAQARTEPAMSRTVVPGSAAPSRAGVGGSGSGAYGQGA